MRLIVFDCDGTLVDSQHTIVENMNRAFHELRLPLPDAATFRALIGLTLEEAVRRLLPGGEPEEWDRLVTAYRRQFFARRDPGTSPEPLYPHATEVLAALNAQGYLLGVATGKSRRGLEAVLGGHDLLDIFVTRQTSDGHPSKPHPAMLQQAMAEAGVGPEDTLMLGDTSFDMLMAFNAGVHPLGVAWGYHTEAELTAAGAQAVLRDFRELLPYVDEQWSAV